MDPQSSQQFPQLLPHIEGSLYFHLQWIPPSPSAIDKGSHDSLLSSQELDH